MLGPAQLLSISFPWIDNDGDDADKKARAKVKFELSTRYVESVYFSRSLLEKSTILNYFPDVIVCNHCVLPIPLA